jgi:hypothetical protein
MALSDIMLSHEVNITMQEPTQYVPNVAVRFDYQQQDPFTEFISLYYTDFQGSYPAGLQVPNFSLQFGVFVGNGNPAGSFGGP